MKKAIVLILVFIFSFSGICFAGDNTEPVTPAQKEFSLPQAVEAIAQSGFNIENLFALIADIADIAAGNGESTTAGNIIRAVGGLVSALIIKDESAAKKANSELIRELIQDDKNLSQLSDGVILDIYEISRDELIKRGIIEKENSK